MLKTTLYVKSQLLPKFFGILARILYRSQNIHIGTNFRCSTIPTIIVDEPNSFLTIGDNVIVRQRVEIRVHQNAQMSIGSRVKLDRGIRLLASNDAVVSIGENTRIGLHSVVNGGDSIQIGKKCLISGYVYLQSSMHKHKLGQFIQEQGYDHAPIIMGDDVWLGAHAVVLPGCTLHDGAIVGSNAVVTSDVPPNAIVAGVPAKILKERA